MKKKDIEEVLNVDTLVPIDVDGDKDAEPRFDNDEITHSNKTSDQQANLGIDKLDKRFLNIFPVRVSYVKDSISYTEKLVEDIIKSKTELDKEVAKIRKSSLSKELQDKKIKELIRQHNRNTKIVEELNEENKFLKGKYVQVPQSIIELAKENLKTVDNKGRDFLQNIVNERHISYENLKKKVHIFKTDVEYSNSINDKIKEWVNNTLSALRDSAKLRQKVKKDVLTPNEIKTNK